MKIGMILDDQFPPDNRVEKEIITLCENGLQIYILCFSFTDEPMEENFHSASVIRIKVNRTIMRKFRALTNTVLDLYTPYWTRQMVKFVNNYNIDILHIHDLYLVGAGLKAKKKLKRRIKVVGDLHENYADALKYYKFSNTFPGNILISKRDWVRKEAQWISQLDQAVVVVEEMKNRISKFIDQRNITICENCVEPNFFLNFLKDESVLEKYKDKFVISYIGAFDYHRGLFTLIQALPLLKNIPELVLCIVGTGKIKDELMTLAKELGVETRVIFEGWKSPEVLPNYFRISDIGVIPHLKSIQTDNSSPNKLYQYMLMQVPVVATNCDSIKRVLQETGAGLIYETGNVEQLAEQIRILYNDSSLRKEMGVKGKNSVENTYNWKRCSTELVEMYKNLGHKIENHGI